MRHRWSIVAALVVVAASVGSEARAWDPLQKAQRAAEQGQRALAVGDSVGAVEAMLRAQALAPDDPRIRAGLAETFYRTGEYEGALRQLGPLGADDAPTAQRRRALYNAGNAAFRMQDYERALGLYTEALLAADSEPGEDLLRNLELAQRLLEQQQQQQPESGEDGDPQEGEQPPEEQDQEGEQPPQDEQQQQQQDQQQQEQGEQEQQQEQRQEESDSRPQEASADSAATQPPPRPEEMTPEEAMRLLQALDFDEEELLESIQRRLRGDDEEEENDW